jgi:hypothetical protein
MITALAGLPRVHEDGARAFRLEADSPLAALNARVVDETGGDRLVLALLLDEAGLLNGSGLAAIEEVRRIMASNVGLERVQAVHVLPLLQSVDGTLTAVTPLRPPPAEEAAWQAARDRVLADPLLRGQLISTDGKAAMVVGWIAPAGQPSGLLAQQAQQALQDGSFRASAAGQRIQELINGARMAVVLGEASGTAQEEVARRLAALLEEGGLGAGELAVWQRYSVQLQQDPEGAVLSSLTNSLEGLDVGDGLEVRLFSPRMVEDAYAEAFRQTVAAFLAALLLTLLWFVARRRGLVAALLATLLCALAVAGTLGACGWMGLALHPLSVAAALTAGLWLAVLIILRPASPRLRLLCATALGAPVLLALPGGPALVDLRLAAAAGWVLAFVLCELWSALPLPERSEQAPPSALFVALSGRSVPWAWLVVLVCCTGVLLGKPMGIDAGRLVAAQSPVGETAALLSEHLGAAPGAFLVLDGGAPGAAGQPENMRLLADVQARLRGHPAVRSVVSWSDLISRLHSVVADAKAGSLPSSASLVDQYLLLFDRPESTRMFVSEDLSLAVGVLRTQRGGGAELGYLATLLPAGDSQPALAGEAVAMSLAVRRQARGLLQGLLLWAAVLLAGLLRIRSRGVVAGLRGGSLAVPLVASILALTASAYTAGAVGVMGALGAAWVLGVLGCTLLSHALGDRKPSYDVFQLLAIAALPLSLSLAMPLRGMGVGLVLSMGLAAFLFEPGEAPGESVGGGPAD